MTERDNRESPHIENILSPVLQSKENLWSGVLRWRYITKETSERQTSISQVQHKLVCVMSSSLLDALGEIRHKQLSSTLLLTDRQIDSNFVQIWMMIFSVMIFMTCERCHSTKLATRFKVTDVLPYFTLALPSVVYISIQQNMLKKCIAFFDTHKSFIDEWVCFLEPF